MKFHQKPFGLGLCNESFDAGWLFVFGDWHKALARVQFCKSSRLPIVRRLHPLFDPNRIHQLVPAAICGTAHLSDKEEMIMATRIQLFLGLIVFNENRYFERLLIRRSLLHTWLSSRQELTWSYNEKNHKPQTSVQYKEIIIATKILLSWRRRYIWRCLGSVYNWWRRSQCWLFNQYGEYLLEDATEKMMMKMINWLQIHHLVSPASCWLLPICPTRESI